MVRFTFVTITFSIFILGCADSPPPPSDDNPIAKREVEDFFLRFRQKIQAKEADSLPAYLSSESLNGLDDLRRAARSEPQSFLEARPFYQILCILALRIEKRLHPGFDDRLVGLLDKLIIQADPVRKTFLKTELGPANLFGNRAEIGLRDAPNVPVFCFVKESSGRVWKFHLMKSLPLILQGAESFARQRKPTHLLQAIYILEQFGGQTVLPQDLNH